MWCLREGTWLCGKCQRKMKPTPLSCVVCKKERARGMTCAGCRKQTPLLGLISAGSYGSRGLRRGVHWLKFKGVRPAAEPLAKLLLPRLTVIAPLTHLKKGAALLPVPLHRRRLRQRGFNQSRELAKVLSLYTGIPVIDGLVRNKATWTQTKLPANLRQQNVADSFALKDACPQLNNKQFLLLVDDVATTGATLSAAARSLVPLDLARNKEIWGLTIMRG